MDSDREKFIDIIFHLDVINKPEELLILFDRYYKPFEKCKHLQSQGKCYACKDDKLDSKWCIKSSKIKELCKQFEEGE